MRTLTTTLAAVAAVAASGASLCLTGCPQDPPDPPGDAGTDGPLCGVHYIGDEDAEMEVELLALDPSYTAYPLVSGGDVSILFPPQGGRVLFVGIRARNLDPCSVQITGTLRDPATQQVRFDARTTNLDATEDGWGQSDEADISTFSNIPVCSNNWASIDVFDQPFGLEVKVKDRGGKTKEIKVEAVPRCDEEKIVDGVDLKAECLCLCKEGYVTGEQCNATQ